MRSISEGELRTIFGYLGWFVFDRDDSCLLDYDDDSAMEIRHEWKEDVLESEITVRFKSTETADVLTDLKAALSDAGEEDGPYQQQNAELLRLTTHVLETAADPGEYCEDLFRRASIAGFTAFVIDEEAAPLYEKAGSIPLGGRPPVS